jgi:hypothetical protein
LRGGAAPAGPAAVAGSVEPTAAGRSTELEEAAAENVKRIVRGRPDVQSPWEIAAYLELKTVWHPIGV